MGPVLHAISLLSATAVGGLFSAIWEGAALAMGVALCLRLLPRLSAAARSVVWMNVFLLLALLHVLPSLGAHTSSGGAFHPAPFYFDPYWSLGIAAVWAWLSLWRGAQLMGSAVRLHGLAARAIPLEPEPALRALLRVGTEAKPGRTAQLCVSPEVERPGVYGFFRPRILIPASLPERLSAQEMRQVVVHEMEHVRRADDWTNLLQKIGLVLFPLNPALLWVERRLCAERELACDDRVLHSTGAGKAYAVCLTRLAEFSMLRRSLSLVLGAWERQPELVRRVHRILRRPHQPMRGAQAAVLTAGLILGVTAGAVALARSPRIVRFAPLAQATAQAHSIQAAAFSRIDLQEFNGHPTLVKAVMAARPLETASLSNHRPVAAARRSSRRSRTLPSQGSWFVLTEWEGAQPQAVVIAVARDRRSAYAAVPLPNGWLIVQI